MGLPWLLGAKWVCLEGRACIGVPPQPPRSLGSALRAPWPLPTCQSPVHTNGGLVSPGLPPRYHSLPGQFLGALLRQGMLVPPLTAKRVPGPPCSFTRGFSFVTGRVAPRPPEDRLWKVLVENLTWQGPVLHPHSLLCLPGGTQQCLQAQAWQGLPDGWDTWPLAWLPTLHPSCFVQVHGSGLGALAGSGLQSMAMRQPPCDQQGVASKLYIPEQHRTLWGDRVLCTGVGLQGREPSQPSSRLGPHQKAQWLQTCLQGPGLEAPAAKALVPSPSPAFLRACFPTSMVPHAGPAGTLQTSPLGKGVPEPALPPLDLGPGAGLLPR